MKVRTKKVVKVLAIVSILAIGIGGAVMVFAGPHVKGGRRGHFGFRGHGESFSSDTMLDFFQERLELTDEQVTQLRPVLEEHMNAHRGTFRKFHDQSPEEIQAEREKMWQEMEQKLSGILTDEQMQKVRGIHDDVHSMMQGTFRTRTEFHQVFEDLDITAAQKAQLFAVFIKNRDERQQAMTMMLETGEQVMDMVLNEEFDEDKVRQTYRQNTAKFEDFVVNRARMLAEMKEVLTPEQLQLLKDKMPELFAHVQDNMQNRHSVMGKWFPRQ